MSTKSANLINATVAPGSLRPAANTLQRKCNCRHHATGGECAARNKERESLLQHSGINRESGTDSIVPPIVHDVLRSPGQPLDRGTRNFFEPRFGHDFSRVRVHTDQRATQSAAAIGARAYAAGDRVVLSDRDYRSDTRAGRRLLAHELAHVVQQENSLARVAQSNALSVSRPDDPAEAAADRAADVVMSDGGQRATVAALSATSQPGIHRTVDDPTRFSQVHESLFAPSGGGKKLLPWEDPDPVTKKEGTAETLFKQAKTNIEAHIKKDPKAAGPLNIKEKTKEADLDKDAVDVSQQLRKRFPFISKTVSDTQIEAAVNVMTPALTDDADYLRQWLHNKMPGWSDLEKFSIAEKDPRLVALLDRLLADPDVGASIKIMASRQSGFQRGEGLKREIFVHRGADPAKRPKLLFHELTHFYADAIYREWVGTTNNERWYNEGFTEYLARLAMPPDVLADATSYQDRVDGIKSEVAAHVPDDDIARAYFRGEIWRIETRSKISKREVGTQLGLSETATEKEEKKASRTGPGINQTVVPGKRYRFMNLGFDQMKPKPEHETFFKEIKSEQLDPAPTLGVRFEGHASTAGTLPYNLSLSLARARAFYAMAGKQGLASSRLIDAAKPPHFGETRPTAEEEDPATRAFNRRVEMEIRAV